MIKESGIGAVDREEKNYAVAFARRLVLDEAETREAADTLLQSNIDAEAAARTAADEELQVSLDTHAGTIASGAALGHVKLSESVSSTNGASDGYAATPSAVKTAYDKADNALNTATLYATCSTAAATEIKDVTWKNSEIPNFTLTTGTRLIVYFTYGSTASKMYLWVPTSKTGDETTATQYYVYIGGTNGTMPKINAGSAIEFVYNGEAMQMMHPRNASDSYYGDVMLSDAIDSDSGVSGATAATPSAVKAAYDKAAAAATDAAAELEEEVTAREAADTLLQSNIDAEAAARTAADEELQTSLDTHAGTVATGAVLGHVKLSSSTSSSSGVSDGYAATPSAVRSAYNRASTAITNAAAAQSAADSAAAGLEEEAAAREAADAELQGQIDSVSAAQTETQSRVDTAESNISALQNMAHTHDNMDVLDGITEERVEAWENNVNFKKYKQTTDETIQGLLNELQTIYAMIGVVSYDGGLFTQAQDGETLDGGAFDDTDLESFDCGG
ncbi:MAG: phage tail protein, partial [Firmicutes bacterium]|nr:phage tail protein [Bacillota bacterium]